MLFGSGFCALVYQIAWIREFRFIFGASTAASAAVVALFIAGLGLGGWWWGRRVDRHPLPLNLYAWLETGVAICAALSPALLWLVRQVYLGLGGSLHMGMFLATVVRLLLSSLVLLVPTFLMGGTLPAAARAGETDRDLGRRGVSLLYGINTLGAVLGCLAANFLLLEAIGILRTLWTAALLNLLVAVVARSMARKMTADVAEDEGGPDPQELGRRDENSKEAAVSVSEAEGIARRAPAWFVLGAAGVVGFAFFLMELVWYRMLGPVLGGTVFTFGLILAVALLGIGIGGAVYSVLGQNRTPSLAGFCVTCLAQAALVALPFALGDRIAIWTLLLRPLGYLGFSGHLFAWSLICSLVVLPAAVVAGIQFPMLIGLLGRGRREVGRQVGQAYAFNTIGAILGSLAGGFGLLPLLSAPGCWQLVAWLLLGLGTAGMGLVLFLRGRLRSLVAPAVIAVVVLLLLSLPTGPTAVWRHNAIGAGRLSHDVVATPTRARDWMNRSRRMIQWQSEGIESSVAIKIEGGAAFVLNGKIDGHATRDASTQIMSGILPACLLPEVRRVMVIGLGTGSTAGWLGALPGVERVDVVELEEAIVEVARLCAPVNKAVLENPKVRVIIGDGREILQTIDARYEIIFSEPSNPYRAGIASLYTREYYTSVAERLTEGGLFVKWVQAYEVDERTIRIIYSTLGSVFDYVETWLSQAGDMLLVASRKPIVHDVALLRSRLSQAPYRKAMERTWKVSGVEGLFSRFIAGPGVARHLADAEQGFVNTDDRNVVEFGFARSVGAKVGFHPMSLLNLARARGEHFPRVRNGSVDWTQVEELRMIIPRFVPPGVKLSLFDGNGKQDAQQRIWATQFFELGKIELAFEHWRAQSAEPLHPQQVALVAEMLAGKGDDSAEPLIERMAELSPVDAALLEARLRFAVGNTGQATDRLIAGLVGLRKDPLAFEGLVERSLEMAVEIAEADAAEGDRLLDALLEPFATLLLDEERRETGLRVANQVGMDDRCVKLLSVYEPHLSLSPSFLRMRAACYQATSHPLSDSAAADLRAMEHSLPGSFARRLSSPVGPVD